MTTLDPYLIFNGNCAEAMGFYAETLGGTIELMLTYGQSPVANECSADSADRVMHARLRLADRCVLASDAPVGQPYDGMRHVSLCLSFDDVAEAERIYASLSEGGEVRMALTPTFWAGAFAMLVDRYGTSWMINGAPKQV
jgi:PhnB protein